MATTSKTSGAREIILPVRTLKISKPCHLLDLPRELRDLIYYYTLVEPKLWDKRHQPDCPFYDPEAPGETPPYAVGILAEAFWDELDQGFIDWDCEGHCTLRRGLNFLRTCKQIYREADGIFWKHNTFCFDDDAAYYIFMRGVPDSAVEKITRVSIMPFYRWRISLGEPRFVQKKIGELAAFSSLTHLELGVEMLDKEGVSALLSVPKLSHLRLVLQAQSSIHWELDTRFFSLSKRIKVPRSLAEVEATMGAINDWRAVLLDETFNWRDLVDQRLENNSYSCREHRPHTIHVTLADGKRHAISVRGLPLLPEEERAKRRKRAIKLRLWEARQGRTKPAVLLEEDVKQDDCRLVSHRTSYGHNKEEMARQARDREQQKKLEEKAKYARHETARQKTEAKRAFKARENTKREVLEEKKRARKRVS